jgi:hypothetical protein
MGQKMTVSFENLLNLKLLIGQLLLKFVLNLING